MVCQFLAFKCIENLLIVVGLLLLPVQFLFAVHEFLQKKLSPSIHFNTGTAEFSLYPSFFIYRLEI